MVATKNLVHDDDEPLLPLMDNNYSKDTNGMRMLDMKPAKPTAHPHPDEILKTSNLSGSTTHGSISCNQDHPDHGHDHSHHHHIHGHPSSSRTGAARPPRPLSILSIESTDDGQPTLEAIRESEKDKRRLKIAIGLCTTFFFVELAGGLWADSLALLSDSFHLLTDITSFVISLVAIFLSHRPSTATHTFGYHRAEVLGALFSIFLIWGLTLMLVVEAFDRIRHPLDVDGKTMSIIAGIGVCVNIVLMFVLGGHHHHHGGDDHDHEHGHSHSHTPSTPHHHGEHSPLQNEDDHDSDTLAEHQPITIHKSSSHDHDHNHHDHDHDHDHGHDHSHSHGHGHGQNHSHAAHADHHHHHSNLNITAATLHVLGDLLSSIGVLISSLIITFYPSLTFLDPICTFVFSILVIGTTIGVFKRSISILMEQVPRGVNTEEVRELICDVPGVLEVKTLHVWSLTIGQSSLTACIYLQPEIKDLVEANHIVAKVRSVIRKRYGIRQCTVQVEMYSNHHQQKQRQRQSSSSLSSASSPVSLTVHSRATPTMDTLARHDQDIIFSVGDEDEDAEHGDHHRHHHHHHHGPSHSHLHGHTIHRQGTPLEHFRENRIVRGEDDEDESENEMEQENPFRN